MSKEKFTQVGWSVKDGFYPCFIDVYCGDVMMIPVCISAADLTCEQGIERAANAHLIASAPDMYEALKGIQESLAEHDLYCEIEAILAKARGEHD